MTHWKAMQDEKPYLFAHDLQGRDVVVQIDRVVAGEITGEKGLKSKKPMAYFVGKKKPLALNPTNCKTIEAIAGTADVDQWRGLWIALFPSKTEFNRKTVDCIRIRPKAAKPRSAVPEQPPQEDAPPIDPARDWPEQREPGGDE